MTILTAAEALKIQQDNIKKNKDSLLNKVFDSIKTVVNSKNMERHVSVFTEDTTLSKLVEEELTKLGYTVIITSPDYKSQRDNYYTIRVSW